jgi:SH3-like domain-containing protein
MLHRCFSLSVLSLALLAGLTAAPARAEDSKQAEKTGQADQAPQADGETPQATRFVSIKRKEVYMRQGPSDQNRVLWIYHRKGLPVEVLASYDVWRRVRDMDGVIGWVHVAMLSTDRTALVTEGANVPVQNSDKANSEKIAEAAPGAIGKLEHCEAELCEVNFNGLKGWLPRTRIWGVLPDEKF